MNCSIHKNRFGKVVGVKTQTGEDSVLFKSLAGLPFIETMEEAATLLASSLLYTPTVSKSPSHIYPETKEPKLFFKTNTDVTESYKTALLNNTDKNVEYGFMGVNGNLIAIGSFSTTTNNDSVIGAINEAISTDLIEEKKVFDGTSYSLKGVGSSKLESKVSAVKAYSLLQAVPNNQYQIMAGGFLSLPQAEVELPETEVDTTPVAETIKNPITAYNTPQELTQQVEQFELDLKEIKEKSIANGTFMLAPNGNNSNLSEIEWLIVRHPNFINWFGDWINSPETASKVVDKNGEPEVVYHGSNTMGFHKFSISYVRDGGFFFSSNDRISKTYTRENNEISFEVATNKDEALRIAEDKGLTVQIEDEDYYIYSNDGLYAEVSNEEDLILTINNFEQSSPGLAGFFINLRDPMVVDGYGANWDEISGYESSDLSLRLEYNEETEQYDFEDYDDSVEEFSTIVDAYQHIESTYGEYVADILKDSLEEDQSYGGRGVGEYYYQGDPQTGEEAPLGMTTREWVKEATQYNNHDGVIFRDIDDNGPYGTSGTGDVFVAINSSDIKSLDNIGQFDSNNEDIRFSKVGKLEGISNIPVSQKEVIQVIKPILDSIGVDYEFKNTEELRTLGGTPSNQGGVPKGAVLGETVYLNSEVITLDTPIHELGHLWINKMKTSNPELYNKGLELINTSDGAKYFEYVKQTQPSLEENSTEFYEEALAQAIGDNGARIIDAKRKTSFVGWVNSLFKWVGEQLGISEISPEKLQTMKLKEFATAVAIETLKGSPSTDVAGGKGVRFKEGAQTLMLQDALKRFELLQGKGGVTNFKVGEVLINIDLNEDAINIKAIKNLSPTSNREAALKELFSYADLENKKVVVNTSDSSVIQILKNNGFIQKYESQESEFIRPDKVNFSITPANSKSVYTKEDIVEVTDAKRYSEAMSIAIEEMKKASPNDNKSLQVDSISETKAQEILDSGGKIFMSKDNMAGGYVLPNGYMGGLFKNPITNKTRAALPLQQARIEAGGRFFDSYDLNEDTYLKNGFRPLVRMDFNEEYAPENWEQTSLVTKPDNVFFIYDPTYKATKGEGDRINDYAEAFSFVTNYLSLENKSANTQGFFSAAVRGEHAPNREWEPEVEFTEKQNSFKQNYYDKHMGNFDAHIATNIPTFRENQIRVASGLVDMLSKEDGTSLIYDIGGSEGGFVKSITDASNGKIRTINLDANQDMQEVHNSNPVEGSVFINEAFFQGFTDNGVTYNTHIPSEKADVVHESMTFQFISHVREPFIKEVKSKYLKEDGIFLLEEKITPETQEQWEANELVKDEFKLKYYSQQYIDRKKEEVLVGMKANQTPYKTLLSDLKKEFLYVEEYWDSGNFKGVIATNSKNKLNAFLDSVGGKMITKYNEQLYKEIPDSAVNSLIENLVNKGDINLSCGI